MGTYARGCLVMRYMKQYILTALTALLILLPARAQIQFSDSLRISLLTCSAGPDAYERFGHTALRVKDLRQEAADVTFHYGVFSFNAPHFIYRFVKGETDYMLGAVPTQYFIAEYNERGLGMTEQVLRLDSAQARDIVDRLIENYRPENRTYRYSFFFDNCATRPYHLLNASTDGMIRYDSTWVNAITLREMVQECSGTGNWLDFGIALAVANRADRPTTYEEQMFLPGYLSQAYDHALTKLSLGDEQAQLPLVSERRTLLEMRTEVAAEIAADDPVSPATVAAVLLLLAMLLSALEWRQRHVQSATLRLPRRSGLQLALDAYDCLLFAVLGVTGCIVWFLNFFSLHPAVDHNINCLWLVPTHVILAVALWWRRMTRACACYCGITFAAVIVYVVADWIIGQYCPAPFLLLLATILLRCYMRLTRR